MNYTGETLFRRKNPEAAGFFIALKNKISGNILAFYNDHKKNLMNNENIIRNRLKIKSTINNAKIFIDIQKEWGSFNNYIWHFTKNKQIHYKRFHTHSILSDKVSNDLKKKGMKFVGSTIIYSYLQAIGVIFSHGKECFKYSE